MYCDSTMCTTCNVEHVRYTARPIERSPFNIDSCTDSTVKKNWFYIIMFKKDYNTNTTVHVLHWHQTRKKFHFTTQQLVHRNMHPHSSVHAQSKQKYQKLHCLTYCINLKSCWCCVYKVKYCDYFHLQMKHVVQDVDVCWWIIYTCTVNIRQFVVHVQIHHTLDKT